MEKATSKKKEINGEVWQFIVELSDFEPHFWRRLQTYSDVDIDGFCHVILQIFNCLPGYHLHHLVVGKSKNKRYYTTYEDEYVSSDDDTILITDQKVSDIFKRVKDKAVLEYDFGDGWKFKITLEKKNVESVLKKGENIKTLEGRGIGIIEDCGGVRSLLEIYDYFSFGEITGEEDAIEEWVDWINCLIPCDPEDLKNGGFDFYDVDYFNEKIKKLVCRI